MDEADRGTRYITCLLLVLWGHCGQMESTSDVLVIWCNWTDDMQGRALDYCYGTSYSLIQVEK